MENSEGKTLTTPTSISTVSSAITENLEESSISTGEKEILTSYIMDHCVSEAKDSVTNPSVSDNSANGKHDKSPLKVVGEDTIMEVTQNEENIIQNASSPVTGKQPNCSFATDIDTTTSHCEDVDKQTVQKDIVSENFCEVSDVSSSEDEQSDSVTNGSTSYFGIEIHSANKEETSSTDKHLSSEMDVNPLVETVSDDEPVVIESNVSEGDSLSLHRGAVVPYSDTEDSDSSSDSSSYESSDEGSDSDDSSSKSESENKGEKEKSSSIAKPKKVQGEIDLDDLPPIQDLHISVRNDQVVEIGKVLHAVDTLVVVEGYKDQPPLDIESVLFLDRGARPLGRIFDVMGPVKEPLYCVRFNSKQHIDEQNIKPDMLVYCAPQTEHSNFIFLQHLLMMKGSDASWKKDREIPVSCQDFSDDEEEARVNKKTNNKSKTPSMSTGEPSPKAARTNKQSSSGALDHQGRTFHPRNPWGWPGHQTNNAWNQQHQQPQQQHQHQYHQQHQYHHHTQPPPPPPRLQNSYRARGHVRPPSFNVESRFQNQTAFRNFDSGPNRYPQFGRESDPRMFGPLSTSSFNPPWPSSEGNPNTGTGYPPRPPMNPWQSQPPYVPNAHNPPPDQRYQAFQSEIARLVDAYNRGAESPMAVPPPMRPPGPPQDWSSSMPNHNYYPG